MAEERIEADKDGIITALEAQRNAALNDVANANGLVVTLMKRIQKLEKLLAEIATEPKEPGIPDLKVVE